jgi:hypothetical protein
MTFGGVSTTPRGAALLFPLSKRHKNVALVGRLIMPRFDFERCKDNKNI